MNENLLQFIWQQKFLLNQSLQTTQGEAITVVNPGMLNKNSGPDFFEARLRLGPTLWAGNIEVHVQSGEWYKHKHQIDPAYRNVILHVVWEEDVCIQNHLGERIPCLELKHLVNPTLLSHYQLLLDNKNNIPCQPIFQLPPQSISSLWLARLATERLEEKCLELRPLLHQKNADWNRLCWQRLAHSFGQKTNAQPFEILFAALPSNLLQKLLLPSMAFQALILGCAGFLSHRLEETYNQLLYREFKQLKNKYALQEMDVSLWKFSRIRPANFPSIRLLQFAELFIHKPGLFETALQVQTATELMQLLQLHGAQKINVGDLHPDTKKNHFERIQISEDLALSLAINALIPVLFLHARQHGQEERCTQIREWLSQLRAEENQICRSWKKLGVPIKKAEDSQALIQLKTYYCTPNRCLECAFGNFLLKRDYLSFS